MLVLPSHFDAPVVKSPESLHLEKDFTVDNSERAGNKYVITKKNKIK